MAHDVSLYLRESDSIMLPESLLIFTGVGGITAAMLNLVGTNLYDIQSIRRLRQRRVHPNAKQYKNRPMVSVIVYTHNSADNIEACLESLLKSRYRKLQIIVADNASRDATKLLVRGIIAEYPKKPIKLYAKRAPAERAVVISYALKAHSKGQLVMLLDANTTVNSLTVKMAVGHFNDSTYLNILTVNFQRQAAQHTAALLQDFGLMLRNRGRKAKSCFNVDYFADYQPACFYTKPALTEILKSRSSSPLLRIGDKTLVQDHANDAVAYVPVLGLKSLVYESLRLKSHQFRAIARAHRLLINKQNPNHSLKLVWLGYPLSIYFAIVSLAVPILMAYFTYLALALRQPAFLLLIWSAITILLSFTILEDEHLGLRQKIKYIGLIPITYGWYYLLGFAQYLTAFSLLSSLGLSRKSPPLDV